MNLVVRAVLTSLFALPAGLPIQADAPLPGGFHAPPGTVATSWVGNSFGGNGGPNGLGYWMQDAADEIKVTPDGTVIAGISWDESGRCIGLYKNGKPNRLLLKQPDGKGADEAWGWGTANNAVAVAGDTIYAANLAKKLLRFRWTPGDLESARFQDATEISGEAVGMSARNGKLVIVYKEGSVETRDSDSRSVMGKFTVAEARDAVFARDGSLWILARNKIRHYSADGRDLGQTLPNAETPSALAWDNRERLLVCDNGPAQQVLTFDVSGVMPRLVARFGERGGLRAGTSGLAAPTKLLALRGAGTDAQGNLYVAMSYANSPNGNLILRAFSPDGKLLWERHATAFVDTFGFDPDADGKTIYSRTAVYNLDLNQTTPGSEAQLRAFTLDPLAGTKDDRTNYGCTTLVRNLKGRKTLFTIGQYAGGYHIYGFESAKSYLAQEVAKVGGNEQWAWDVTESGDIWHGDAAGNTIRRYAFRGWTKDGKPDYDWQNPQTWPRPEGWELVRRVHYAPETDSLYLTGYLTGQKIETWGVVGPTIGRYDGWLAGKPTLHWTNDNLPRDEGGGKEGPITPESIAFAGNYFFVGMTRPNGGKQLTHALRQSDGAYVGTFAPDTNAVGTVQGWLDMPYAVQAIKRRNGEYLILVEEDARAKNLLYRWRPEAAQTARSGRP